VTASCSARASSGLDRVPRSVASSAAVHGSTWVGYVTRVRGIDAVRGRWIEPTYSCRSRASTSAAIWLGLDGFGNATVEQIGTEADCRDGVARHSAWMQRYPDEATDLAMRVSPGDELRARVALIPGGVSVRLRDVTTGDVMATTLAADAPAVSAEWVVEAPSSCRDGSCSVRALTPLGRASFSRCAVRVAGRWRPLAAVEREALAGTIADVAASAGPVVVGSAFDVTTHVAPAVVDPQTRDGAA
jgi:hypothetical protein